ncbi:MAG: hypothetical protein ACJAUL_001316 [Paraglaciecola sp.]|jgi:hypothetical protein
MFQFKYKKIMKLVLAIMISLIILKLSLLQNNALVNKDEVISPDEMNVARNTVKEVADKLASYHQFIEFDINQQELSALSKLGSHLLPKTQVNVSASELGILVSTTTELQLLFKQYVNVSCWFFEEHSAGMHIDNCSIGNVNLSGWLVQKFFISFVHLLMGDEAATTANELITNSTYKNEAIVFSAEKSKYLKNDLNESLETLGDLARFYARSGDVSPEVVQLYINEIEKVSSIKLADHIQALFNLARQRSINNAAEEENTAIIWALAVKFGNYRFAKLIGVKPAKNTTSIPLLRGRPDLTQHFIYSAALQQLSDLDIGLQVGEAKELLDSISGGSGYSFADLAADKAGLAFASYITSKRDNAQQAQALLINIKNENAFFPFIHDLPEGFTGNNFKRVIQSIESDTYKQLEAEIDRRLNLLSLYSNKNEQIAESWALPSIADAYKNWIKVDTHIHTKFSDGSKTVGEIAEKAFEFGCDAIAITDHGDYNLKKVASDDYFNDINAAANRFPFLTIIPGLEWNIPPMNGREHATVLLPKSVDLPRNLSAFRDRYDHYKQLDEKLLSPQEAFEWLSRHGVVGKDKAVVIYNHPSRKDYQTMENEHDITYWRNFSKLVVGFSGAPGHQKKRGDNNGSYETRLKTVNGWDPAVETIGGEWDRLLQKGYKVWAARAASDFHNNKMDYWPCQFSTTHLLAKSNSHNDVLSALHSGAYWAQHGKFINHVDFSVQTNKEDLLAGQSAVIDNMNSVKVNLSLTLNELDWQGYPTSLDHLELVIITANNIRTIPFYDPTLTNNQLDVSYDYQLNSPFVIFRWRGRSIQPEEHHYMFYTNPIKIERAH